MEKSFPISHDITLIAYPGPQMAEVVETQADDHPALNIDELMALYEVLPRVIACLKEGGASTRTKVTHDPAS